MRPPATSPVSRRDLLCGGSASVVFTTQGETDPALDLCRRWQAIERRSRGLILQWQRLETWLFHHRSWASLTPEQRTALPEAAPLDEIDARLDRLEEERQVLLPQIQAAPAQSRAALLLKFDVATKLFAVDEQPEARALLRSIRRDLVRLWP